MAAEQLAHHPVKAFGHARFFFQRGEVFWNRMWIKTLRSHVHAELRGALYSWHCEGCKQRGTFGPFRLPYVLPDDFDPVLDAKVQLLQEHAGCLGLRDLDEKALRNLPWYSR